MTQLLPRLALGLVLIAGPATSTTRSQAGPPAAPRDLETWSYYDSVAQETETGLHLVLSGRGGAAFLSITVRQPGRSANAPARAVTLGFGSGPAFVTTEHQPTLRITVDEGKPYQTIIDMTSRLGAAPTTAGTGRPASRTSATPQLDEVRVLAEAETIHVGVFGGHFDLRPDQIRAIKTLVDRVSPRAAGSVPTLAIDKKRFATAEPLLLYPGVRPVGSGAVPPERRQPGTLTITRPDRRTRTEHVPWPTEGLPARGWVTAIEVDREAPQQGEYRAVFTHGGRESAPVFFSLEDVPVLRQIDATFVFPTPNRLAPGGTITLVITNKSRETIRVAKRGGRQGPVRVELKKTDGLVNRSLAYPGLALLAAVGLPAGESFPIDELSWTTAASFPTDVIRPGATVRVALPLAPLLTAMQPTLPVGEYEVTFSTLLTVLIAERGGPWSELSPVRIHVEATSKAVR